MKRDSAFKPKLLKKMKDLHLVQHKRMPSLDIFKVAHNVLYVFMTTKSLVLLYDFTLHSFF